MREPIFRIVEIFETLQGEGYNTGMPSIFVRFGKCNLACSWCDTNYHNFDLMTLPQIMNQIHGYSAQNIVITGGEPTIQPQLELLLNQLKSENYFIAIETNGLKSVPTQIDYIATSPKRLYADAYEKNCLQYADEVRIVVDNDDIYDFCSKIEQKIKAKRYYLSPCEQNGSMNILSTITLLGMLNARVDKPHWQLSIQTHKLCGID